MADAILARGGGGGIKKIQFFDWSSLLLLSDWYTRDITIDEVNPDNTIILHQRNFSSGFRPDVSSLMVELINSTTVRVSRYNINTSGYYASDGMIVIEFENVKFKQTGTLSRNGNGYTHVGFSQIVNPDKVLTHFTYHSRSTSLGIDQLKRNYGDFDAYGIRFMHSTDINDLHYQIIEFY